MFLLVVVNSSKVRRSQKSRTYLPSAPILPDEDRLVGLPLHRTAPKKEGRGWSVERVESRGRVLEKRDQVESVEPRGLRKGTDYLTVSGGYIKQM